MGARRWEQKRQWWKRIHARQKLSTRTADNMDEAEVDMNKAKIDKSSECNGAAKGVR